MNKRMTIECACERGGDCTRISACSADSMLQDQDGELQHKLASLTGEVDMWRKQVTELEAENTRLQQDFSDMKDFRDYWKQKEWMERNDG